MGYMIPSRDGDSKKALLYRCFTIFAVLSHDNSNKTKIKRKKTEDKGRENEP